MLTVKQPQTHGYKSVHDLPTPPSANRISPTLSYQDSPSRQTLNARRSNSPITQPMSTPHRGLPPPAAMALPPHQQQQQQQQQQQHQHQQQSQHPGPAPHPPPPPAHAATHHHHQHQHQHQQSHQPPAPSGSAPSHPAASQSWNSLPAPPPQWQGAEESMRNWLQTRAEEEKTRQEEEKTRQESLRLEQRKIEADMLRASLERGVPPQMVPLVFAGMGGGGMLSQTALEWAQQMLPPSQSHQLQLMAPQGPTSPHHQREHSGQGYGIYGGQGAQASGPAGSNQQQLAGSPIRARAQTTSTSMGHSAPQGSTLPGLSTSASAAGPHPSQAHSQLHGPPGQQEASPSIYFHHWQPPTTQSSGSSNRPGTPSGDASRKRKAASTGQSGAISDEQPSQSPTTFASSENPLPQSRRTHKRQRSDLSWYRPPSSTHDRGEGAERSIQEETPSYAPKERSRSEVGKHSVSSLLSSDTSDQGRDTKGSIIDNPPHSAPAGASARSYRSGE